MIQMGLPKPYYHDERAGITIYHGDSLEIMPTLDKVDIVVTDPPWNLGYFQDDKKPWNEYKAWLSNVKDRLLKLTDGPIWIFQSTKAIPYVADLFEGWGCFASVKNFCQIFPKRIANSWDIAFYSKHEVKENSLNNVDRNWHKANNSNIMNTGKGHPTSRPLDALIYILQFYESGTVLDPFMGSGTTLRAAKDVGHKAIGIEIEEKYCEIAVKRLAQGVLF